MDSKQLTLESVLKKGVEILKKNGIDCAVKEARLLAEKNFGVTVNEIFLKGSMGVDSQMAENFFKDLNRRLIGEPIQYILGQWSFMGIEFKVGGGVLIPRPETELLAEYVIEHIGKKVSPVIFDLCAGSGCIGISIASFVKDAEVLCFEKYDSAFVYLKKNIEYNGVSNVKAVKWDVLRGVASYETKPDVIVSNPPYIPERDIDFLQKEVKCEPKTALDGGGDGLEFYRAIAGKWVPVLKDGGILAVECGIGQSGDISEIFKASGLSEVGIIKDYNNVDRIVKGVYYYNA